MVTLTVMVHILLRVNIAPPESYHVSWAARRQRNRRRGETTKGRRCARGKPRLDFERAPSPKKSRLPRRPTVHYTMGRQSAEAWSTSRNSLCGLELYALEKSEAKPSHSRSSAQIAQIRERSSPFHKLPQRATKPTSRLSIDLSKQTLAQLSTTHLLVLALTLLFAPTTIPALATKTDHSKITDGCGASTRRAHSRPHGTRTTRAVRDRRADRTSARPK